MLNLEASQTANKKVVLEAVNLSKIYGSGEEAFHAVKDMSLKIYEGNFTVIMGSSGSGKSTLLSMLSGLDSISDGEISFKEKRIDLFTEKDLSEFRTNKIGYVYQSIHLVPDLSLYENIVLPGYIAGRDKGEVRKKAMELMQLMDIVKQKDRMPSQVSGGQQQRAAIARALINTPQVIFADEPTGALNLENGERVLDILTEMNRQGQSIVMVTHDIKAACRADRLVLIIDGMVGGILELPKFEKLKLLEREKEIYSFVIGKES